MPEGMRACPCCMETLTPGLLGLGGRRLAGSCEVCGDAVCQTCLGTRVLEAGAFRKRAGISGHERQKVKGRVCRSCLWDVLTDRGHKPPFPAPPGQRARAARAARESCAHPNVKPWMGFCPDCGDEVAWKAEPGNPVCEECGAPSHRFFNCCWACGESFDEENTPQAVARGYRLEFDCDSDECTGKLAWLMPFCPWCGEAKHWQHSGGRDLECAACESSLDRAWAFCVRCGEEAPLPDDCLRCALSLEEAQSAARCEQCRNIVCGDCFDIRVVPTASGEKHERLLCSACGVAFQPASDAAEPQSEENDEESSQQEPDEDEADEEAPDGVDEDEPDDESDDDEPDDDESDDDEPGDDEPDDDAPDEEAPDAGESAEDEQDEDEDAPRKNEQRKDEQRKDEQRKDGPHKNEQRAEEPRARAAPQPPPPPSPWEVLGVAPNTPMAEVRRAYLALVAQYHPDKVAALGPKLQALAQEETRRIIEAWEQLRRQAR